MGGSQLVVACALKGSQASAQIVSKWAGNSLAHVLDRMYWSSGCQIFILTKTSAYYIATL